MKNKILFFYFCLIIFSKCIFCQDIHFSQFYAAPQLLNPANTGNINDNWRLSNIYRNQWKSLNIPFTTISIGFDKKIPLNTDYLGFGLNVIDDKAASTTIKSDKINLSFSYTKVLGFNQLHYGIQFGYVFKNSKLNGMTFPTQFDMSNGFFNSDFQNDDPLVNEQISYFDLHTGLMWSAIFKRMKLETGVALYHLNRPNEAYISGTSKLPVRKVFHGNLRAKLSKKFVLVPQFMFMNHKRANDLIAGSNLEYLLPLNNIKLKNIFIGCYARDGYQRNTDAVFIIAGLNIAHFDIGISYDINISQLKTATSNKGAFEISLIYNSPISFLNKTAIPCNLY